MLKHRFTMCKNGTEENLKPEWFFIFFVTIPSCVSETTGLKDTTQVENLQDQALAMLRNHIESSSPSNTTRFGRLLMLLANLRFSNAQRIEKTFFEKIIGNAKMEKLLCDMFQS